MNEIDKIKAFDYLVANNLIKLEIISINGINEDILLFPNERKTIDGDSQIAQIFERAIKKK